MSLQFILIIVGSKTQAEIIRMPVCIKLAKTLVAGATPVRQMKRNYWVFHLWQTEAQIKIQNSLNMLSDLQRKKELNG